MSLGNVSSSVQWHIYIVYECSEEVLLLSDSRGIEQPHHVGILQHTLAHILSESLIEATACSQYSKWYLHLFPYATTLLLYIISFYPSSTRTWMKHRESFIYYVVWLAQNNSSIKRKKNVYVHVCIHVKSYDCVNTVIRLWHECVSFPAWTVWRAENCPYCQQFYIQSQNRQKKINTEEGKVSWTTEWVLSFLKAVTKEINILSFCVSCCHPPPYFHHAVLTSEL